MECLTDLASISRQLRPQSTGCVDACIAIVISHSLATVVDTVIHLPLAHSAYKSPTHSFVEIVLLLFCDRLNFLFKSCAIYFVVFQTSTIHYARLYYFLIRKSMTAWIVWSVESVYMGDEWGVWKL